MRSVVLVPVKRFADAKGRLAGALDPTSRAALARRLAARVIAAAAPLPVAVVCDDDDVAAFARTHGADVLWTPGLGLNGAVAAGIDALAADGVDEVVVAHADLPFAADLGRLAGRTGAVTLVPDRALDGTNVLVVPAALGFRVAYGPGSFAAHRAEAVRLGVEPLVVRDERLAWDVDRPDDLHPPARLGPFDVPGLVA